MAQLSLPEVKLQKDDYLYHGAGKYNCDPPVLQPTPFWFFADKRKAYHYGVVRFYGRNPAKQQAECWNILTFNITRDLRLLDLSTLSARLTLREILKKVKYENPDKVSVKFGDLICLQGTNFATDGIDKLVDCMFPNDILGTVPTRNSQVELDKFFADLLFTALPQYDGWVIGAMPNDDPDQLEVLEEEIMLRDPTKGVVLAKQESYSYDRIKDLIARCQEKSVTMSDCHNLAKVAFQKNQLACLVNQKANKIHCYLLEELTNQAIVTEKQLEVIKSSLEKGESYIELM